MKNFTAALLLIILVAVGCTKQTETYSTGLLSEYYPLQVGTSILYQLDSTVPAPFGTALVVKSYQAKDSVEAVYTDNQGRTNYRVFRFVRNAAGTSPWTFAATYVATLADNGVEYVDNNMRFLKLKLPLRDDYTFKGHTYIDTKSLNSNVMYLDEWEYEYRNVNKPYTINGKTFDSTITVFQHDETIPDVPFTSSIPYQQRNYGIEVYAKGVGLIYKDFLHWTWQSTPPPSKFEDGSFGVKLTYLGK